MDLKYVFFGEDLNRRAPEIFGHTCTDPGMEWVGLVDIGAALLAGNSVSIRHASEAELQRAEALIALRNVGEEMALRIAQLLDHQGSAVVTGALTSVRDALESVDDAVPYQLLDQ
jgi:hypothetical protein